jgi:hypothetical protein
MVFYEQDFGKVDGASTCLLLGERILFLQHIHIRDGLPSHREHWLHTNQQEPGRRTKEPQVTDLIESRKPALVVSIELVQYEMIVMPGYSYQRHGGRGTSSRRAGRR